MCKLYIVHLHVSRRNHAIIIHAHDCLGRAVLLCLVCLFDLCFFLSSFSSLIDDMYMHVQVHVHVHYFCVESPKITVVYVAYM